MSLPEAFSFKYFNIGFIYAVEPCMPLVGNDKKAFTNIFECINHDIILWYIIRVARPRISLNNCKWSQVHIDSIRHLCQTVRDGSWQAATGESLEKIESWPVCYYLVLVSYKEHDYTEYYFGACVHHVPMNYRSYELRALSLYRTLVLALL